MIKRFCDQCQREMKKDEPLIPNTIYHAFLETVELTFKVGSDLCKSCLAQLIEEEARQLRKGGGFSK